MADGVIADGVIEFRYVKPSQATTMKSVMEPLSCHPSFNMKSLVISVALSSSFYRSISTPFEVFLTNNSIINAMPPFGFEIFQGLFVEVFFLKPGVDVSLPKVKVKMNTPKGDINVDAPDINIDGKGEKFSQPHMRMPKIKIPGFKHEGTDLETDISVQKGDVTFKGPEMKENIDGCGLRFHRS